MSAAIADQRPRLLDLLSDDGRAPDERNRLVTLILEFASRPTPTDLGGFAPRAGEYREALRAAIVGDDGDAVEETFLTLYCHLHGHEAPYSVDERRRMDETGGYWCHAGGISPVIKAAPFVHVDTVLADFGAGNGLQGLLIQRLHPHRRTVQIEISGEMIEIGRRLQSWLEIPSDRVDWIRGDVLDVTPEDLDFIYLYRPVRPVGPGLAFYERFGATLAATTKPVVIFSVADCLGPFLPEGFEVIYGDGHLTCYRRG